MYSQIALSTFLMHLRYWEWGLDVENLRASHVFDGSPYSMSSDGEYIPHGPLVLQSPPPATGNITLDAGTGGGCVFSGPFKDYKVNLGPLGVVGETPVPSPLSYNPRCLKRDLTSSTTKRFSSFQNTT
jgi:tyrosinase